MSRTPVQGLINHFRCVSLLLSFGVVGSISNGKLLALNLAGQQYHDFDRHSRLKQWMRNDDLMVG